MRIILGLKKSDCVSVKSLLKQTGYLSVNRMAAYHSLQEMFAILKNGSIPSLQSEFVSSNNEFHDTRHKEKGNLILPKVKRKKNGGFVLKGSKLWNKIPAAMKKILKKKTFSAQVKEWVQSNIPI